MKFYRAMPCEERWLERALAATLHREVLSPPLSFLLVSCEVAVELFVRRDPGWDGTAPTTTTAAAATAATVATAALAGGGRVGCKGATFSHRHEPFARKLATWPSTITIDLELGWGFYDRWIERATARLELLGSVGHGWVMGEQFVV